MRPAARPKPPHANRGVVREQTTDFQTENQAPGWPKTGGLCLKVPPPSDKRKKGKKTTPAMEKWLETSWFLIGSPSRCRTDATGRANAAGLTRPRLPGGPPVGRRTHQALQRVHYEDALGERRPARHGMPFASGPCWPGCTCRGSGTERTASRRPCITRTRRWQKSGGPR